MSSFETNAADIKAFAEQIYLPDEAQNEVLPICSAIYEAYAENKSALNTNAEIKKFVKTIAKNHGIHQDLAMLAVLILMGMDAHDLYRSKNISDEIYFASMKDITIWTKTCMKEAGHVGLYEFDWVTNFIRAEIVRLHRLEFHQITFNPVSSWQNGDLKVKKGEKVINIHVPEDGPFSHEDVLESYRRAYRYFGCTGKAAFVCHSWLLYPGLLEFLPENSNIRKFADDFEILKVDPEKDCHELWRVFGKRESYVPGELPRNSSLQAGLADYLAEHDNVTGSAYGIFAFDGEKIIE